MDDTTLDLFGAGPEPENDQADTRVPSSHSDTAPIFGTPDGTGNDSDSDIGPDDSGGVQSRPEAGSTDGDSDPSVVAADGPLSFTAEVNGNVPDAGAAVADGDAIALQAQSGGNDPDSDIASDTAPVFKTPEGNGNGSGSPSAVDDGLLSFMGESGANGADSVDGDTHPDLVSATVESGTDVNEANFAVNDSATGTDVDEIDSAENDLVLGTSETESNLGDSLSAGNDSAAGTDVDEIDSAENDLVLGTPGVNSGDRAAPRRRSARQRKDSGSSARRVALVTGASRGIGRGIALALARERWFVVVNYAGNASAADETLEQVRALGGDGVTVQADLASATDRARLVAAASETTGRIDLLVNNAGIAPPVRSDLLEIDDTGWDTVIDTNLRGTFFLTQAVAREMLQAGPAGRYPGRIVMVSSISADTASVNRGAYCVSKAGIAMLVKLFAARLAEHGIAVHEVRPGVIETDMTSGVREKYDHLIDNRAWPIARWGHPDDIGKAVAALARGDFPFSTGDTFHVDGGWHLRTL